MLTKVSLKKEFEKEWQKNYSVELFKQKGFERKQCHSCSAFFWTLDQERKKCGNPPCEDYNFIGNKLAKKKLDYVKMWKEFEKFFVENGHTSTQRYPVIDRWRPDLFFTIASIQDFQRIDLGKMNFVYPANPLVVPQVCLRFPDIPSVGLSGRHLTSFIMSGQHAFGYPKEGYFKDRCMELDFGFLNGKLGVDPKDLVYVEDLWHMPDFSAFGPSIETYIGGLEVGNHVFMEFQATKTGFTNLDIKVNDTGWGHERLVWLSNGTNTIYDCVFGDLVEKMKKYTGIKVDKNIFEKFSKLAGRLNIDEAKNLEKTREEIAKSIGVSVKDLVEQIEPLRALYAIADHTRTLLFAVSDGGFPSNVGGGYNLRVLFRRCLAFMDEYNLNLNLVGISEKHAEFLKPMFPELKENIDNLSKIFSIEEEKYKKTLKQARSTIEILLDKKEKFNGEKVAKLYESQGITPELIKQIAKEKKVPVEIPEDFYEHLSSKHIIQKEEEKEIDLDLSNLPDTKLLFYENPDKKVFDAKIIRITKDWIVLDQTLFYPESGGQENDTGFLEGKKILDVQKFSHIVVHKVDDIKPFKVGQLVNGKVNWDRRLQLRRHHTSIHILNGAVKKVLGKHAWQAGTHKSEDKATLDITHYQNLTTEEVEKIETLANEIVKKSIKTESNFVPRGEAEKKFGLGIYQGGHIPEKTLRILEIPGHDTEACSGTHVLDTAEIEKILIVSTEKIQDGIIRLTIKAADAAGKYTKQTVELYSSLVEKLNQSKLIELSQRKDDKTLTKTLQQAADVLSVSIDHLESNINNFISEILDQQEEINKLKKIVGEKPETLQKHKAENLDDASNHLFELWKTQRKQLESLRTNAAKSSTQNLLKKAKDNQIFDVVNLQRKELTLLASELLKTNENLSIILANETGDIIGMSNKDDMEKRIKDICSKCNGAGGGNKNFAQGKVELSKLLKIMKI